MAKLPKFGKVIETQEMDVDGSTVSIETNYANGQVRFPRYRHVEDRVRVNNTQEEMTQYLKHCEDKIGKIKTSFYTETNKLGDSEGWYYAVKCWTEKIED